MTDVTVPAPPPLVRIPHVELVHTGTWPISTGVWTATREDLQAAVAALDCPAIHRAGIKIGHADQRFTDPTQDGEPLLGYVDNLGGEDDWNTLVGDFAGVPAWLGGTDGDGNSVISSAYPQRSIEGVHDFRCQIGHTHPFVLTAVALLGVTHPGVGTLQSLPDLMALYGVAAAAGQSGTVVSARVDSVEAHLPGMHNQLNHGRKSGGRFEVFADQADALVGDVIPFAGGNLEVVNDGTGLRLGYQFAGDGHEGTNTSGPLDRATAWDVSDRIDRSAVTGDDPDATSGTTQTSVYESFPPGHGPTDPPTGTVTLTVSDGGRHFDLELADNAGTLSFTGDEAIQAHLADAIYRHGTARRFQGEYGRLDTYLSDNDRFGFRMFNDADELTSVEFDGRSWAGISAAIDMVGQGFDDNDPNVDISVRHVMTNAGRVRVERTGPAGDFDRITVTPAEGVAGDWAIYLSGRDARSADASADVLDHMTWMAEAAENLGFYDPGRAARVTARRITASAASAQTKAMVALVPSAADVARLAVDGGLAADDLHLTLLFLGDAIDWDDTQQQAVIAAGETLRGSGVVIGDGFALSVFNPGSDDKDTCIVLGVGGEQVDAVHDAVTAAVDGAPEQQQPWVAHISLLYTDDLTQVEALVDRTGPVTFDRLRVAFADHIHDIPLTDTTQATAGPGERSTMPNPSPTKVAAGVTTEDVRRQYYDESPSWDYWITEFHLDPLQLIVCNDRDGKYYRVPVVITGEDTFEFGAPAEVLVRYVDVQNDQPVTASAADKRLVYASRAESRPGKRPAAANDSVEVQPVQPEGEPVTVTEPTTPEVPDAAPADVPAAQPDAPTNQEDDMSLSAISARLGLGDDADEAAVLAALDAKLPTGPSDTDGPSAVEPAQPVAAAGKPKLPDGVVAIDASTLEELRRGAALGVQAAERQRVADRDRTIEAAREDGRISPARVGHWVKAWEADPDGTRDTLASLEPGLVVPVVLAGSTGTGEETADLDGFSDGAADAWAAQLGIDAKELTRG